MERKPLPNTPQRRALELLMFESPALQRFIAHVNLDSDAEIAAYVAKHHAGDVGNTILSLTYSAKRMIDAREKEPNESSERATAAEHQWKIDLSIAAAQIPHLYYFVYGGPGSQPERSKATGAVGLLELRAKYPKQDHRITLEDLAYDLRFEYTPAEDGTPTHARVYDARRYTHTSRFIRFLTDVLLADLPGRDDRDLTVEKYGPPKLKGHFGVEVNVSAPLPLRYLPVPEFDKVAA